MKKQILNLGKALNKAEQRTVNGGGGSCWMATNEEECSNAGGQWYSCAPHLGCHCAHHFPPC